MNGASQWKVLTGGHVPEPEHGNLDQLTSMPGPARFLNALFAAFCSVDVASHKRKTTHSEDDGVAEYRFICGTDDIGYEQTETVVLESSDFPVKVTIMTFGLPEIELSWTFVLTYQGQLGHCGFEHRRLMARFDNAGAEARFESLWTDIFGHAPVFAVAPPAEDDAGR